VIQKSLIVIVLFLGLFCPLKAQSLRPDSLMNKFEEMGNFLLYRNHDSTYISSYAGQLTTKLLAISKINYFRVKDNGNASSIRFRPDRKVNLGIGISYKWFALDLAFNFGIGEQSNFENSKSTDFQGAIFSSKQYISGSYQYYYGYQYADFSGVPKEDVPNNSSRDDIRTMSTVIQYLFAFNYDKFSLKAPFIQNELQRKSAGSFLIGARFHLLNIDSDSSMVPSSAKDYFNEEIYLTSITGSSVIISVGYMYSFVFREHFYATLGLIPGIGVNLGDFKSDIKQPFVAQVSTGWSTMNAIGYNSSRFFGGIQLIADNYSFKMKKDLILNQGHGKIKFHIGYRFGSGG
jgi:hypothetical protein